MTYGLSRHLDRDILAIFISGGVQCWICSAWSAHQANGMSEECPRPYYRSHWKFVKVLKAAEDRMQIAMNPIHLTGTKVWFCMFIYVLSTHHRVTQALAVDIPEDTHSQCTSCKTW